MIDDQRPRGKSDLACEILAYLSDNPGAQDTLEGIVEWWLLEQKILSQTARVKEAIGELVAKGLVLENTLHDSQQYYRLNARRRKEIQAILKEQEARDPTEGSRD